MLHYDQPEVQDFCSEQEILDDETLAQARPNICRTSRGFLREIGFVAQQATLNHNVNLRRDPSDVQPDLGAPGKRQQA